MSKILIIGASKGIGQSISNNLINNECILISREYYEVKSSNHKHHALDVINDNLPEIDEISSIIYCLGTINLKPFRSLKNQDFENDYRVNVLGAVKVIQHYQKALSKSENASIVLFSTVAVSQGMPFHSSIAAAKGAIEGLTKSLAAEFAGKIRVNCIAPTITNTPLASGILRNDDAIERANQRHPSKKINQPEDVAAMASFLINKSAKNITGQIIHIDGGMSTLKV
ncbi:MAG: oxidoreductase [Crocinitomicaceae bacterium]|nr:oxidoreductase [Crocinitomicaceae bacterium]|tara:strand:- start:1611 stop:2291 length:681 start_codon:yes stop_codon:yes gene_type:complete